MVGFEGMWGILLSCSVIAIASYIPCSDDQDYCNEGHIENIFNALSDVAKNCRLLVLVLTGLVSSGTYNFSCMTVTKHLSALTRTILSLLSPALLWVYDLTFSGTSFNWMQASGFGIVIFGNLIYNEILEVPGLNRKSKAKVDVQEALVQDTM